ncbi:MAG TPA: MFS transporter, partial [Candidatus Paenibacillus intestinavium]|nr:MFS transporter [Candidatus Paenibacillus intestinavium]
PDTSRTLLTLFMILVGFGMGFSFSLLPTASQHNLEPRFRGTANSTNAFLRTLGMTMGITIFGTIQNKVFTNQLTEGFKDMGGNADAAMSNIGDTRQIFEPSVRETIPAPILEKIVDAMSSSIAHIFLLAIIPIAAAVIFVFMMGNSRVVITKKQDSPQ